MNTARTLTLLGSRSTCTVGTIVAVGRNYDAHAREMGAAPSARPLLFLKPASALVTDGGTVRRPVFSQLLHHELELVVAIGHGGGAIDAADALAHVLGYAVGLDMTLRDVQDEAKRRGHPWAVAKGFDTAAPVSALVPADRIHDPSRLELELLVNGERRQHGWTRDMILDVPHLIAYISSIFRLERGDLIFTGTPEGVGPVAPGDRLEARLVDHVALQVTVEKAAAPASR
ncbi:MAG: fumarylacetoacetate hydrolase family protein [Candidatus Eiseniibacteriota bacterium]|jgi:2-keto-4-pentenoate hydratase/2-oxohepta-3-ene-1,7-dioic acid hydratase in catechol pathway